MSTREQDLQEIRTAVSKLCAGFPGEYWRTLDRERKYPTEFVRALTEAGYLSCLIPEQYGGSGLGLSFAATILEEIQASGANGAATRVLASIRRSARFRTSARVSCSCAPPLMRASAA